MRPAICLVVLGLAGCVARAVEMPNTPSLPLAWTPQTSGVTATLRGVSAASEKVVWASGSGGTILRTEDAGETWKKITPPLGGEKLDFRDVDAVNERTAYILSIGTGELSRIYKTTDAGATWALQFTNIDPLGFYDAMAFWNADRGIAIGDSVNAHFVIITTSDGGKNWTRVPDRSLPPALPNEGAFAASGTNVTVFGSSHVWIGTGASTKARVLRSSNRGGSWQIADTPLPAAASSGIYSIAFRDERHGVIVGGDYAKEAEAIDNVATTGDGGKTWTLAKPGVSGFRSVVARLPKSPFWLAVGPQGADFTFEESNGWKPIPGQGYHAFSFSPTSAVGWGVGGRGRIGKLTGTFAFGVLYKVTR